MPIIGALLAFIGSWFVKKAASLASKVGLSVFQSGIGYLVIALQVVIGIAISALLFKLYNAVQDIMDYIFDLQSSSIPTVATSVNVLKAVGVWDGSIDALHLITPFITSILIIKFSTVAIRLLKTLSDEVNKVIKTALSYGF
ncbi:hypothetical protein KKA17_08140 [bacterium]|nr:hypothetical protein [bacterium]